MAERNGHYYHIIARGREEQRLFESGLDYRFYLNLLKKYKKRFSISIHGFCLMPDYVSFIVRCGLSRSLFDFLQRINRSYTVYFNTKYKRSGRLWREHVRSILLKEEDVWDGLKAIEFGPVRLGITDSPVHYSWSSCRRRILRNRNGVLDPLM